MRPPTRTVARTLRAALVLAVTAGLAVAVPTTAQAQLPDQAPIRTSSAQDPVAEKPYMGWSSWSLQTTSYPG